MGRREHRCGKRPFWERFFILKPIILPRQARDKYRKNSKKKACCAEYGFTDVCEKQFGPTFTYPDDDSAGPLLRVNEVTPAMISASLIPFAVNDGPLVTPIDVAATIVVAPEIALAVAMPVELTVGPLVTATDPFVTTFPELADIVSKAELPSWTMKVFVPPSLRK